MGLQHSHVGDPCPACEWPREHHTPTPSTDCGLMVYKPGLSGVVVTYSGLLRAVLTR